MPRKSLILKPPKISKNFFLPFILGYFDGDGSISKTSQYNNYSISIQGTKEILLWICEVLNWDAKLEKEILIAIQIVIMLDAVVQINPITYYLSYTILVKFI